MDRQLASGGRKKYSSTRLRQPVQTDRTPSEKIQAQQTQNSQKIRHRCTAPLILLIMQREYPFRDNAALESVSMAFQLDIRTLSFITVLFCGLYGIGLMIVAFRHEEQKGITQYGQGVLILGLGFLLLGFRGGVPQALSVVLANWLILAAFVLFDKALSAFRGSRAHGSFVGTTLLILHPLLFYHYTYQAPSVSGRITVISLFLSIVSAICAWGMARGTKKDIPEALWLTVLPFVAFSGFLLFRSLWAVDETHLKDFMSASTVHQLAFLVVNLLVLTSSFGLVWLLSARLQQELREQARIDTLTRAYNRRALGEIAVRELARCERHGLPISAIMSDIDHFKKVNDTHGHRAGDIVLANFAGLIREVIRKQDYLIRYGGEEFLILLPDTAGDQAEQVAEKLRTSIQEATLCTEPKVSATASFGVATLEGKESWESMASRADKALYQAKNAGRNRVVRG